MLVKNQPQTDKPAVQATEVDWQHPLARGLRHCWLLNEGGKIIRDLAFATTGTLQGAASFIRSARGVALRFPGATGDYVNCGNPADVSFGDSDFSLVAWVQTDTPSVTSALQCIIYKDISGGRQFGMGLTDDANSAAVLILFDSGGTAWITHTTVQPWSDTGWHHLVGQRVGTTLAFYVDGRVVGDTETGTFRTMATTATQLDLGRREFATFENPLNGRLSQMLVYNRSLSAPEVRWLFAEPYSFLRPVPAMRSWRTPAAAAVTSVARPGFALLGVGS